MENKTGEGLTDVAVDVIRISPALNCRWGASNNSPGGDNDAYAYVNQVKTLRVALLEDASDELSVIRQ